MVRVWFALLLTVVIPMLIGFGMRQRERTPGQYPALHMVALVLSFVVAMISPEPVNDFYKGAIGTVLLLVIVREAIAWAPGTPRAFTVGTNFFVWFLLWLTVNVTLGSDLWSWAGLLALIPLFLLLVLIYFGRRTSGNLWITLSLYAVQPALALGLALVLVVTQFAAWSIFAFLGIVAFAAVDLLLAQDLLRSPVRRLALWQFALTGGGALLLALSIWGPSLANVDILLGLPSLF
jgi:hypothetical protein